jgi:hypothetical protein
VIEFYATREAALAQLAEILVDEPGWLSKLSVVRVCFAGPEVTVEPV